VRRDQGFDLLKAPRIGIGWDECDCGDRPTMAHLITAEVRMIRSLRALQDSEPSVDSPDPKYAKAVGVRT